METDVELDAKLVLASMRGGIDGFMAAAFALGLPSTRAAMSRAEWLMKQPEEYVDQVTKRVAELEQ